MPRPLSPVPVFDASAPVDAAAPLSGYSPVDDVAAVLSARVEDVARRCGFRFNPLLIDSANSRLDASCAAVFALVFSDAPAVASLVRLPGRRMQSTRRYACASVLSALLRFPPDSTVAVIARGVGLSPLAVNRALADCVAARLVFVDHVVGARGGRRACRRLYADFLGVVDNVACALFSAPLLDGA